MFAFYDAFADYARSGRVLDAGAGAGVGSARLIARGFNVLAVDSDANTVAFARQQCPQAEHAVGALESLPPTAALDGAIVADVLGHARDPEAALFGVARSLRIGAPLFIAEAAAHVSQRLLVPHRRAFSVARLRSLMVRAGLDVEAVVLDRVPFVALIGRVDRPAVREAFTHAYALASEGHIAEALVALEPARGTGRAATEVEALLGESELCFALGDGDRAASACFRARELVPNDARPLVGIGRIALAAGSPGEALELALDALRHDPTETSGYVLAALAASELGESDTFTAWRAAGSLAPDDAFVVGELTRQALQRGNHAVALHSLDRLEQYDTALEASHHVTRAWLLIALGRRSEAAVELRIARAKQPTLPELGELELALAPA